MSLLPLFATCARGIETLVARELAALGASGIRETVAGVYAEGDLETAYRIGYCARLPSRWLLRLADGDIASPDDLYALAHAVPWHHHFGGDDRFAIHVGGKSPAFRDTRFALLRVKDAIADAFRERTGSRPYVDAETPDALIHIALKGSRAALSLDLVGGSLHERGYRVAGHEAPIKENLAAAVLVRAGWPALARDGQALVDPFCGGGTLLIEGLWMAADVPTQCLRTDFAWARWLGHDAAIWQAVREQADTRGSEGLRALRTRGYGSDLNKSAIALARRQLQAARVAGFVQLEAQDARRISKPAQYESGLVIANLPYGERMGEERELMPLHREFGARLQAEFVGWRFALLAGTEALARATELRAEKPQKVYNGTLECLLITGSVAAPRAGIEGPLRFKSAGAEMVYNRICKNRKKLKRWLEREQIHCYRIYDADLPEYAAAIDVYEDRLHIQEYQAPAEIPVAKTEERFKDLVFAARRAFDMPAERVYLKQRRTQTPDDQYRRQAQSGEFFVVREADAEYEINLQDYLDTGLFLDGRQVRAWLRDGAVGARFLNLFCYTGSATVAAALGGARESVSVDLSPTYLGWAERNFRLNGLDLRRHRWVQADVVSWLAQNSRERFDLIYVDPPSFSNSKRTTTVFDVQRDHVSLLQTCIDLLAPGGRVLFVCNLRKFKLDPIVAAFARVDEVTEASIPPDFARDQRIHRAYWLRRPEAESRP